MNPCSRFPKNQTAYRTITFLHFLDIGRLIFSFLFLDAVKSLGPSCVGFFHQSFLPDGCATSKIEPAKRISVKILEPRVTRSPIWDIYGWLETVLGTVFDHGTSVGPVQAKHYKKSGRDKWFKNTNLVKVLAQRL